jgi:hypothetical protein
MSDDFHRPTYTSREPATVNREYNPTQVRLYGIPGKKGDIGIGVGAGISAFKDRVDISIDLRSPEKAKDAITRIRKLLDVLERDPTQPIFSGKPRRLSANFGPIDIGDTYKLGLTMKMLGIVTLDSIVFGNQLSAGIMFGYAYEGHTYDFPKPKIMFVPTPPLERKIPDDSGYDAKFDEGYTVWLVDKLDQCIEIEANQGFVEQLVLDANMPGKRSPTQYKAMMTLAHRGGRLSE